MEGWVKKLAPARPYRALKPIPMRGLVRIGVLPYKRDEPWDPYNYTQKCDHDSNDNWSDSDPDRENEDTEIICNDDEGMIEIDDRWEKCECRQQRRMIKKRRRFRDKHLISSDLEEYSSKTGLDCTENTAKYKDCLKLLESLLDDESFGNLLSFHNENLLNEYQIFQQTPAHIKWTDVMSWARTPTKGTDRTSSFIKDFFAYLYAKLSFFEVRQCFSKTQFLIAVRINNFVAHQPILSFENCSFANADLLFKQSYKRGYFDLKPRRKYKANTTVHTELQLLYGEKGHEFVMSGIEKNDLMLIFSHYIPCQDNSHSVNDCASNMATFFAKNSVSSIPPAVVVAYDQAFPSTDTSRSELILTQGNITLLSLSTDCYMLECICHEQSEQSEQSELKQTVLRYLKPWFMFQDHI